MRNKKLGKRLRIYLLFSILITGLLLLLVSCQEDNAATDSDLSSSKITQGEESTRTRAQIQEDGKLDLRVGEEEYQEGDTLSYELMNHSGYPIFYGADLRIERKEGKRWFEVYFESEAVIDIGYGLESGYSSEQYSYARSEDLPPGEYRLTKEVTIQKNTNDNTQNESVTLISNPFTITEKTDTEQGAMNESVSSLLSTLSLRDRIDAAKGISLGEPSRLTVPKSDNITIRLADSEFRDCGLSEKEYIQGNPVSFQIKNKSNTNLYYAEFIGVEADIDGVWTEVNIDFAYEDPSHRLEPDEQVKLEAPSTQSLPSGRYRLTKEVKVSSSSDMTKKESMILISDPFLIIEK